MSLTIRELTEAAGVSVRTVRYYIAEGLLPPPEGAGPASVYTRSHLDRLRLITRLKDAYLPLKEIRRRLAGLDDEEVRTMLAAVDAETPTAVPLSRGSLGEWAPRTLRETHERYHTEPLAWHVPATAPFEPARGEAGAGPQPARHRGPRATGVVAAARPPRREEPRAIPDAAMWHRIPLGDEAELVISDRVYGRHRDRIDWLVRWARKVFG
jgi:DNA-binding transcriptional MerR regulator